MGFLVTINKQLINGEYWNETNKVTVYALDYCTIGVSPVVIPDWARKALYVADTIMLRRPINDVFIIELNDYLVDFYRITERKYEVTGYENFVLIAVTDRSKQ